MIELVAGAAIAFVLWRIGEQRERRSRQAAIQQLVATFGPAMAASRKDPEQLLTWYPLARSARALLPAEFRALDEAAGRTFPFTRDDVQHAHARCSSEWLAWERAHDAEFAVKAAELQEAIDRTADRGSTALLRTRIAALEQQKLERYQQKYEAYVRMSKGLAALADEGGATR